MMDAEQNEQQLETDKPKSKHRRRWFWKLIFVIFLIAIIGVAYYYFRRHHSQYVTVQNQNKVQLQISQTQLQQLVQQQQSLQRQQAQILTTLQQHGLSEQPLVLANVVFMLQRATLLLQTEQNVAGAIKLLQISRANLHNFHDTNLIPLQRAVKDDLALLQAIKTPDINQLSKQLQLISRKINHLTLALTQQNLQKPTENKQLTGWRKILDDTWQSLRDVIIVERTDQSFKPLMNRQDLFSFKLYLQNVLQQVQWAVLNQNNTLYHQNLTQLQFALSANIAKTNVMASQLQQALAALQQLNVQPAVPTQLRSLTVAEKTQQKLLLKTKQKKTKIAENTARKDA